MFTDIVTPKIQGFVKITDVATGDILLDTHNDILYGNMSVTLAHALLGNSDSFLYYLAFGNGGSYVAGPQVLYRPTLGGPSSIVKNPTANLYDTTYVKKLSNESTPVSDYTQTSKSFIPAENYATSYEDIITTVILGATEPPTDISANNTLIFNEIGLFAGSDNLFAGEFTQTNADVNYFVAQTPNFSNTPTSKSKLMLTHVIFQPIAKATTQSLEIVYTLRIQMGVAN